MTADGTAPALTPETDDRGRALLERHYERVTVRTDRLFTWLLAVEWIGVNITSLILSPRFWTGAPVDVRPHLFITFLVGGLFAFVPIALRFLAPGRAVTRHAIAAGQLLMTGLIIHVSGREETQFLVFGSLAFLAFYRDWRVLVTASIITAGEHLLRGTFLPLPPYVEPSSPIWRTAEHVGWVAFADVFLITLCVQSSREMWKVALKRSQLERTKEVIEATVVARTHELEVSQALFQSFMAHTPVIGWIVDDRGIGVYLNRTGEEAFGISADVWLGKPVSDIFGPALAEDMHRLDLEVIRSGEAHQGERVLKTVRGWRRLVTTRFLIEDSMGQRFVGGTSVDVTERDEHARELATARDAAIKATRLKSEFLANMSHEIRTPMNGIVGLSHLLLERNLGEEERDYVETIVSSANALLTIINDILDFSKIEAGKLSFDDVPFDLRGAVEETVELLAPAARRKNLQLLVDIAADCPLGVRGDPGRVRQVLTNLLGNAIKFTDVGEVRLLLSGGREDDAAVLRFDLWDTGIGISPESRARLFQTFSQADGSTTRKYGGSGLGLVIAKELVQRMGGSIDVKSEPGVGSHFWFTLRLPAAEIDQGIASIDLRGARVLIVDDHPTNRLVLERQLGGWGVDHRSATGAEEAMEILEGEPRFDAVIVDLQMPHVDGLELARWIRSRDALKDTHILLLSSSSAPLSAVEMRRERIDACLLKPVRQARLHEALGRILFRRGPAPAPAAPQTAPEDKSLRILVAEDNVVNQKVVRAQLAKLGYAADLVADGREAVAAFEHLPYDVILMDCQMPELDGFDASRIIRERERAKDLRAVRIIALTANAMESDRERCLAAGMDDYLSKPVKIEDLRAALERPRPL